MAIRRVFGNISGSAIETVKCSVVSEIKQEKTAITFLGKVIAAAKDKNTKMHHDDEVIYTIGEPTAGGSKKHWYSIIPQGSEFIIHDVPVDLYQNYVDGTGIYASLRKNIVIVEKR